MLSCRFFAAVSAALLLPIHGVKASSAIANDNGTCSVTIFYKTIDATPEQLKATKYNPDKAAARYNVTLTDTQRKAIKDMPSEPKAACNYLNKLLQNLPY